jgi:hypothetical protein
MAFENVTYMLVSQYGFSLFNQFLHCTLLRLRERERLQDTLQQKTR